MASLAGINIKFSADLKEFQTKMQTVQKEFNKVSSQLQNVGKNLTLAVSVPLVGLGALAVKSYAELEGVSAAFDRLNDKDLLNNLREATKNTVSDFELMKNAVKANNFEIPLEELGTLMEFARRRAKETGENVDYLVDSIVTGIGRKSPLILDNLGISASALKDELNGASVASSSIGAVTEAVGKIARAELAKMGEDTLTLKELWLQFKTITQNSMTDLGKAIADVVRPYLIPLVEKIKEAAEWFKNLSPETKKFIVILGGVAAAIGPLLALAGTILPAIITGFTLLTGPVGLAVAAIAAVGVAIYKNWAPIKKTLIDVANYFIDLYNESVAFRIAVEGVIATFKTLWEVGKFVFEGLKSILKNLKDNFVNNFKTLGDIFKAVLTGNIEALPEIISKAIKEGKKNFDVFTTDLDNDWKNLMAGIEKVANEGLANVTSRKKLEFLKENVDASAIKEAVEDAVKQGLASGISGKADGIAKDADDFELKQNTLNLGNLTKGNDLNIELAKTKAGEGSFMGGMAEAMQFDLDKMDADFTSFTEKFEENAKRLQEIGVAVGEGVGDAFESLSGRLINSLGLASTGFQGFIKGLAETVTKLIAMMLSQSIAQSIAGATASGTATGPGAIFTTPAFIATAVSGVMAAFAAIPKFAEGGIVGGSSFYGDKILARLNSGELILNNSQQSRLYKLMNSGAEAIVTRTEQIISGDKLILVTERAMQKKNRRG